MDGEILVRAAADKTEQITGGCGIFLLFHFLSAAKFPPFPNVDPLNPAREKMPLRFFWRKSV